MGRCSAVKTNGVKYLWKLIQYLIDGNDAHINKFQNVAKSKVAMLACQRYTKLRTTQSQTD